jgi:hypothetical protein
MMWIIRRYSDPKEFWQRAVGWSVRDKATHFTDTETERFPLPADAVWVEVPVFIMTEEKPLA